MCLWARNTKLAKNARKEQQLKKKKQDHEFKKLLMVEKKIVHT
jgi:hypothetical protein